MKKKFRNAKVRRLIEYEGPLPDVDRHLAMTLLSLAKEFRPGENPTKGGGSMMIHGGKDAPKVTIRLIAEQEYTGGGPRAYWRDRRPKP